LPPELHLPEPCLDRPGEKHAAVCLLFRHPGGDPAAIGGLCPGDAGGPAGTPGMDALCGHICHSLLPLSYPMAGAMVLRRCVRCVKLSGRGGFSTFSAAG